MNENILSISEMKIRREQQLLANELNALQRYYRNLDFHGLIQETHGLIEDLDRADLNVDMLDRSLYLLKEYEHRCQSKSPQMLETLLKMRESIEIRVKGLGI